MMDVKTVEKNVATQTIEKRDGRVQKYDPAKIKYALIQAVQKSKLSYANETIEEIADEVEDRKSTRLNSSHVAISYAVFCLKKKKQQQIKQQQQKQAQNQ